MHPTSEGVYGLTVISSSTSATYWTFEIAVGVAILALGARRFLRSRHSRARPATVPPHVTSADIVLSSRR